jgi:hypothetical protein
MGNVNYEEVVVRKDIIAPAITINSPSTDDLFSNIAPSYDLTVVEGNLDSIWYSLDGGTTNSTPVSVTGTISLVMWSGRPNGTVTLRFYANDTMGNVNYEEVVVRKDIILPLVDITNPAPDGAQTGGSIISISGLANGTGSNIVSIYINDTRWGDGSQKPQTDPSGSQSGAFVFNNNTNIAPGFYWIEINITDAAGNINTSLRYFEVIIEDTTPPILIISSIFPDPTNGYTVITIISNENLKFIPLLNITLPNSSVIYRPMILIAVLTWSANYTVDADGIYTVRINGTDDADNVGYITDTFEGDITAPSITINIPNLNDLFGISAPSYDLSVADANLDSIWYSLDGGITNSTPVSATGTINLGMWSGRPNGTVTIRFYANDTAGNLNFTEIVVRKDIITPDITINSPSTNDLFGINAPSYDLTVADANLDSIWYSLDGGITNSTPVSATGTINLGMWSGRPNGTVTIRFYANDTMGNVNYEEVVVRKDIFFPIITINTPNLNDVFNSTVPSFIVTVSGSNLHTRWYTLDDGLTNYTFSGLNGTINQLAWDALGEGTVTIKFYINNTLGVIGFDEVTVIKDTIAPLITINLPLNNTYCGIAPILNVLVTDANLDSIWYEVSTYNRLLANNINQQLDSSIWSGLSEGEFYIYIYANDSASALSDPVILRLYKDTIAPSAPILLSFPQGEVSGNILFEWQAGSDPSGILKYRLIIDTEADPFATPGFVFETNATGSSYLFTGSLQPGTYYFSLYQIDGAGHQSSASTGSFSISSPPPPSQPSEFPLWIIFVIIGAAAGAVVGIMVLKKSKGKKEPTVQIPEKKPVSKPVLEVPEELSLLDYDSLKDMHPEEINAREEKLLPYIKYLEETKEYTKAAEFIGELILIEDILGNSQEVQLYRQKQIDVAVKGLEYLKDQYEIESKKSAVSGDYSKALELYKESKLISENLKKYMEYQEPSDTKESTIVETMEPQPLMGEEEPVYSCINDLLTKYFDDIGIKYYSNPQIYDNMQDQIHGLILTDNELQIADIDPSIIENIKSIQIIYTEDLSNENVTKLCQTFHNPYVVLIIVGIKWPQNIEAQTIDIPPIIGAEYQKTIRIIHYELFTTLIGLRGPYETAFKEIINLYNNSEIEFLRETHESSEVIIHGTDELRYDLREKGLITDKLEDYFYK